MFPSFITDLCLASARGALVALNGVFIAKYLGTYHACPPSACWWLAAAWCAWGLRGDLKRANLRGKGVTKGMFLALKPLPDGSIEESFNGPASVAHQLTVGRKADAYGFVGLSHTKLRKLMESVPPSKRITLRRRPAR